MTPSPASRIAGIVCLLATMFFVTGLVAADEPRFTIERVRVEGLRFASEAILVSESRLVPGRAYSEPELRDALARIQRLPFVVRADFALQRGDVRGQYVLVVTVEEMKPLFFDYGSLYEAIGGWTRGVFTNSDVYRFHHEYPNLGGRLFLGSHSMVLLTANLRGNNDFVLQPIYGLSWTQYDIFGTRASASASVRYREDSLDLKGFDTIEGRRGLRFGDHLLWDFNVAVPLSGNQAIRAEAHREFRWTLTGPDALSHVTQYPLDNAALVWIYNSTNDLLFPSRGTYGELRGITQSRPNVVYSASNSFIDGKSWENGVAAQFTHYLPVTGSQSLVFGGDGIRQAGHLFHVRAGYTATRPLELHGLGATDLHAEAFVERAIPYSQWNVTAGVALRNTWGIVHIDFRYLNLGGHPR